MATTAAQAFQWDPRFGESCWTAGPGPEETFVSAGLVDRGSGFYGSNETVAPAGDRLDKPRLLGIISQHLTNLADGIVDAVVRVQEDVLAPNSIRNLLPGDKFTATLKQEPE